MIRRIVEISSDGFYLSKDRGSLVIRNEENEKRNVPISDISVLMLTANGVTLTKALIVALLETGAVIVICGKAYMPVSIITPLSGNYELSGRFREQVEMKQPLKKQLWKTIVVRKILNQALVLESCGKNDKARDLKIIAQEVTSGDTTNREGFAARIYWNALFGKEFKRIYAEETGVNAHLNYGYAILRSIVARGICATGLHPALGIKHTNKLNEYCLADDLMEPFRPMVDYLVLNIISRNGHLCEVSSENKAYLSKIGTIDFIIKDEMSPLINAVERYAFSFYASIKQKSNFLNIPVYQDLEMLS